MNGNKTWILIADGRQGKVFTQDAEGRFSAVPGMIFDQPGDKARDLVAGTPDHRDLPPTDIGGNPQPPDRGSDNFTTAQFVKVLADQLDRKAIEGAYDKLVIAADPQALGDLRKCLSKRVQDRVAGELSKDLTNIPTADLPRHFGDLLAA